MLRAENISISYRKSRRKVLEKLDFTLEDGEFCGVMGESGIGKSTLLAVLSGFLEPEDGRVSFGNTDLYSLADKEMSKLHKDKIAYVPQSNILLKDYTVLENTIVPFLDGKNNNEESLKEKAEKHLKKLGIAELKDNYPFELSGGEQKRASLVRALLMEPEVLIADEPTAGLDSKTGKIIMDYLSAFALSGRSVLVATHDEHVKDYADRIFAL